MAAVVDVVGVLVAAVVCAEEVTEDAAVLVDVEEMVVEVVEEEGVEGVEEVVAVAAEAVLGVSKEVYIYRCIFV